MMISVEASIARSRAEYAEAYAGLLDDPRHAAEFKRLMGLIDQSEKDYRAQGIEAIGEDIARLLDVRTVKERHYLERGWGSFRDGREIVDELPPGARTVDGRHYTASGREVILDHSGETMYSMCHGDWWRHWPEEIFWTVGGKTLPEHQARFDAKMDALEKLAQVPWG